MITRLRAQNFKSWKDTGELRLAPLTGLFGTNSSGKTSILQVLLLLKQTVESSDPNRVLNFGGDEKAPVDLGTFVDVIHQHDTHSLLKLSLSFDSVSTSDTVRFDVTLQEENERIVVVEFLHSVNNHREGMKRDPDGKYNWITDHGFVGPFADPRSFYDFPPDVTAPSNVHEQNLRA